MLIFMPNCLRSMLACFRFRVILVVLFLMMSHLPSLAQDRIFSGPQKGERATAFSVVGLRGDLQGQAIEWSNEGDDKGKCLLVFVHGLERSMAPLMRVLDAFGQQYQDLCRTDWVFLSDDPVASRQRLPMVGQSLKIKGRMLLSSDGSEGPGNYGLNKQCLLTILLLDRDRVLSNHALIQPGLSDAEAILASLSSGLNIESPPTAASLMEALGMTRQGGRDRAMRAEQPAEQKEASQKTQTMPGAVPSDPQLVGFMRQFLQPDNTDARVDQILREVNAYIEDDSNLIGQAIGGWTRLLHVKYGTPYAQQQAAMELTKWQKAMTAP